MVLSEPVVPDTEKLLEVVPGNLLKAIGCTAGSVPARNARDPWKQLLHATFIDYDRDSPEYKEAYAALLQKIKSVNARDSWGQRLLSCAVEEKNAVAVGLLIRMGADPKLKDNKGKTALSLAAELDPYKYKNEFDESNATEAVHSEGSTRTYVQSTPVVRRRYKDENVAEIQRLLHMKPQSGPEKPYVPAIKGYYKVQQGVR
jgi:hypothetical protein